MSNTNEGQTEYISWEQIEQEMTRTGPLKPWHETTTVEDLLHLLESECPVSVVTDAVLKKHMTADERARLIADLEYISQEARDAIAAVKRGEA